MPKKEINVIDFTPPHRIVQKSVSQHRIIIERLTCTMAPQDERCCGIDRTRKIVAERREAEKERQREAKKMRKQEMEKKRERERVEDSGRRGDQIEVTPPTNTIDRIQANEQSPCLSKQSAGSEVDR
ncbi:uncharacterized protein F5891DRAFT_1199195 [Suillus fuscotomentosus]|uniref:Uncharacterized protein n=1 Tax=Suillus fuscotomentosus TaxID=1912939 RepID=A0AAD4DR69_9AGAM|nr:uncharacterized protein F5891DRAFT_1199195 [Suillus fuscotomentosus]KAG1888485.1 hypothetical protein F5891DRAFT_1199195 [Suillus fuscotomentosus]